MRRLMRSRWPWAAGLVLALLGAAAARSEEQSGFGTIVEGVERLLRGIAGAPAEPEADDVPAAAVLVLQGDAEDDYTPALKRMLAAEAHFLAKVCGPSGPQLAQVRAAGEAEVAWLAREYRRLAEKSSTRPDEWPSPRARLVAALRKRAAELLPQETMKRYDAELAARAAASREAGQAMLVAALDCRLLLSPRQRERVAEVVRGRWNEAWSRQPTLFLQPATPGPKASVLAPALSARQLAAFRSWPAAEWEESNGLEDLFDDFWFAEIPGLDDVEQPETAEESP